MGWRRKIIRQSPLHPFQNEDEQTANMDTQSTVILPCTIVNISGRPYRALIDSGAEISLMHYDVAKEMNIHYSTEVEPAYGADQKPIAVEGVAQSRIHHNKELQF